MSTAGGPLRAGLDDLDRAADSEAARDRLDGPARPADLDPVDLRRRAETEVEGQRALAHVTRLAVVIAGVDRLAGKHADGRPQPVAVRARADEPNGEPVDRPAL